MTLSLHKLWAGSGYEYLTRQVARQDSTHPDRSSLASYYTERGETPGVWVGSGLAGVEGLRAGDVVTAEQMRSLFGQGLHPLAEARIAAARAAGAGVSQSARVGLLGSPFRSRSTADSAFETVVTQRLAEQQTSSPASAAESRVRRAEVVSEVAGGWFERQHGRAPADSRELSSAVARWSGGPAQPVAGFDLTFSPVKSVSALWAVAPPHVAARVEECHRAAVEDALRFVEQQALFSREGARGVRQVEVTGLVATAFTHRDSRAGDPDLHTHVAVANKVQTHQGKWLAIDGRVLYAATVAASETYNTALERHLEERLGLRFAARTPDDGGEGRRPVREVVGVDPRLLDGWSSRRRDINGHRADLARDFQQRTGRPPTRKEAWGLAQQATLATRPAKHEPRTVTEQRVAWASQAERLLGSRRAVDAMVARALTPRPEVATPVDAAWIAESSARVVAAMEAGRATWGIWHLQAEAQRQVRTLDVPPAMAGHVADLVVGEATNRCVPLTAPTGVNPPPELRRSNGTSVYETVGSRRWTSTRVLDAELQILATAARRDGRRADVATVDVALREAALDGPTLNAGQVGLVRDLAGSRARVQVALAPAGTGKTTALRVLAKAWVSAGGNVVGLAPSAAAAAVLGEQLDGPTDTLAKLVWSLDRPRSTEPRWVAAIGPESLVVVDEAGLADSPSLARAIDHVLKVGGSVRLVGDDQQLAAVGAGGLLRDLANRHGAARLDDVVRFADPAEAAASLALRDGRPEALGFYLDEHRVHVGDPTTAADQLFTAWTTDRAAGLDSLMLAPTRDLVVDLNARARTARLETTSTTPLPSHASSPWSEREVTLADRNHASVGDTVITKTNDRRLTTSRGATGRRWVRNGDRWHVTHVHRDGRLTVSSPRDGYCITLPAGYVTTSVELGYASTIHAAQGSTCDTVHGLLTGRETRAQLYTLLTRGRTNNHAYLQLEPDAGTHEPTGPDATPLRTATQVLEQILHRDGDDRSATGTRDDLHDPALRLADEIDRYLDSLRLAAERTTPSEVDHHVTATAERLVPGLTDEPAWPTLRSQLLLAAATETDPAHRLTLAVAVQPLDDSDHLAHDRAAVLHRRIVSHQAPPSGGRLPWLPAIPDRLCQHPTWGPYLTARATLIDDLSTRIAAQAVGRGSDRARLSWTTVLPAQLHSRAVGDIAVWRASQRIPDSDPSPLGPPPADPALQPWYHRLVATTSSTEPDRAYGLLPPTNGSATDPFRAQLGRHLTRLVDQGVDIEQPLHAAADGPALPDDHPSAALWWRLHRHVPSSTLTTPDAGEAGWPAAEERHLTAGAAASLEPVTHDQRVDVALLLAGLLRLGRPQQSPARGSDELPPARRAELLHVNELTLRYYQSHYPGSWSARHLTERCGTDLDDDARFSPGHAPAGWTHLTDHLRSQGVSDQDLLDAGVARRTQRGHLVDLFRDRLVLPIRDRDHDLVGFVARRHDDRAEDGPKYLNTPTTALYSKSHHLYGAHLLTPQPAPPAADGSESILDQAPQVAVLVEGPLDAIAVTLAAGNRHAALATLGTALTDHQAALLADRNIDVVLAMDPDAAGTAAAERAFWTLTATNVDPCRATLPSATDPADLYQRAGADGIRTMLGATERLGDQLTRRATQSLPHPELIEELVRIAAARPPHTWAKSLDDISERHGLDPTQLRERLLQHEQSRGTTPDRPSRSSKTWRSGAPPRPHRAVPDQRRTMADDPAITSRRATSIEGPRR